MPLCVLLGNTDFKAFNGGHHKPMQYQLKFACYIFLLHFEKPDIVKRFHHGFL